MKIGDIIFLSDEKEKKYLVLSTKETNEKCYALITEFNALINVKERKIKNANIDLRKAIAISSDKQTGDIEFINDTNIIAELCSIFYPNK